MIPTPKVSVLGTGVYLPPHVRTNDDFPEHLKKQWQDKAALSWSRKRSNDEEVPTPGVAAVLEGLSRFSADPFRGTRERHIMGPEQTAAELELRAAEDAIERAGVDRADIDLVLGFALCPDFMNAPSACVVHRELGLRTDALAMDASAVCNSFQAQLFLAGGLIEAGRVRNALILQSSAMSRMEPESNPMSTWFGDGAAAVVLGPSDGQRGVLASVHHTDGALNGGVVGGVPGGRWYDEGRAETYSADPDASRNMLLCLADRAKESLGEALARAGLKHEDVDFYACHQSTAWMQDVTSRFAGLDHAKTVETFSWAGTLSAANIPLALTVADKERVLERGDIVALFSPGTGMTWSATILRW